MRISTLFLVLCLGCGPNSAAISTARQDLSNGPPVELAPEGDAGTPDAGLCKLTDSNQHCLDQR